jgi:hypothetical protein
VEKGRITHEKGRKEKTTLLLEITQVKGEGRLPSAETEAHTRALAPSERGVKTECGQRTAKSGQRTAKSGERDVRAV